MLGFQNPNLTKIYEIVRKTIKTREENNIVRKDMLQLLLQLRNAGKVEEDDTNFNWSIQNLNGIKLYNSGIITEKLIYL